MTTVRDIEKMLFAWAPRDLAADWDNVGHLVGEGGSAVRRVLVSLDITEPVVEEAVTMGADLIVSHHPIMNCTWHKVQHITDEDAQGRMVMKLLRHGISAICMHTNLDAAEGGVNDVLANALGLSGISPLNDEKIGRIGTTKCEIPLVEFTSFVLKSLRCNGLRYTDSGRPVHRVAVGGGACGEYIENAMALGCDTFVSSDLKYHEFLDHGAINLIDAGHFPTENLICPEIVSRLQGAFPDLRLCLSQAHRQEIIQYCIKEK